MWHKGSQLGSSMVTSVTVHFSRREKPQSPWAEATFCGVLAAPQGRSLQIVLWVCGETRWLRRNLDKVCRLIAG